jgi:hypothetical protein
MTEPSAPYRDPALPVEQRVEDLLARLTLADKAGLMFHDMAMIGHCSPVPGPSRPGRSRWASRR